MSKLIRRHLREMKLLITNWFLASVDDLYSEAKSGFTDYKSGLINLKSSLTDP